MTVLRDTAAATTSQGLAAVALAALSQFASTSAPSRGEVMPPLTPVPSLLLFAAEAELGGDETVLTNLWESVAVALADKTRAPAAAVVALAAVREVAAAGHLASAALAPTFASAALDTVLTEVLALATGVDTGVVSGGPVPDQVSGTEATLRGRAFEALSVVDWARGHNGARRQSMIASSASSVTIGGRDNRDPVLAFIWAECAVRALVDAPSDEFESTLVMLEREAGQQRSSDSKVARTFPNQCSPVL